MSFNVKITAVAASMFAMAIFLHAPNANAESAAKTKDQKASTKTVVIKPGDSLSSLAEKHHTTWVRLYNANKKVINPDLIHPGDKIVIPTEDQKLPDRYNNYVAAPAVSHSPAYTAASTASNAGASANYNVVSGNAYDWGQCTWYVKNRRPDIGSFWGNAGYSWLASARAAGFTTSSTPRAGAVAVQAGHVAYVESVDGGNVRVSEMNWNGGVGIVSYRTTSASTFSYIY